MTVTPPNVFNHQDMSALLPASNVSIFNPQGFQVVCEASQSVSSSPAAGEQSCRPANSVEKGGTSQQPLPVKGPAKKK